MQFADVTPGKTTTSDPWISVKEGSAYIGLSSALVNELGISDGQRMVLAFTDEDGEYIPWIGFVDEQHSDVAPKVQIRERQNSDGKIRKVQSEKMGRELEPYATGADGRIRLKLSGDGKPVKHPDADENVFMHRLVPPSSAEYDSN